MKITAKTDNTHRIIAALTPPQAMSLSLWRLISIVDILLYLTLYFSRNCSTVMLITEGTSITMATTAPLAKSGMLPSI